MSEKRASGKKSMRAAGRKLVEVWLDGGELALITTAATAAGKPLATWIREQAFHAAEKSSRAERKRTAL